MTPPTSSAELPSRPLPPPQRVRVLLEEALGLPALAASRETLERLLGDYERGQKLADAPLRIALVGATGAGKSTLLNALAGVTLAQEGETRPTSREPTVFAPEGAELEALEAGGAKVVRYRAGGGSWSGQVLVDTPDLNSVERVHRERTARALEACDVALVVMHRGSVAEAVQAEFLEGFARRRRLLFVLNYADEYGKEAREALKAQVRELAHSRLGLPEGEVHPFAISAREAKAGRDVSGEFGALLLALREMGTRTVAERVRHGNAAAALAALSAHAREGLEATDALLAQVHHALGGGMDAGARTLRDDFEERLALAEGHLAQSVRRQAAGRGWGPAALWMRLSLVGAGGLGAATLLARASLPAGLAVAAASTVLDAVQARTRAAAARERVLAPGGEGGVAERAARTALVPARAAATAAGLAPGDAGIPTPESLSGTFQGLREEAWRFTEGGAVAAAVSAWWRWARWVLLPLINLPLLALLAHVAWRVVHAYVEGPLLPATYFLNAAALAVVLAIVGGTLASLSLSGAVRRVKSAGQQRFEERLAEVKDALLTEAGGALSVPRRAARELADLRPAA